MIFASTPLAVSTATFVVAAVITTLLVPQVRRLGLRLGLTDLPDSRKQHSIPMVRLGGIALVLGFCLSLGLTWWSGGLGC